jgi:hypothetical protein
MSRSDKEEVSMGMSVFMSVPFSPASGDFETMAARLGERVNICFSLRIYGKGSRATGLTAVA